MQASQGLADRDPKFSAENVEVTLHAHLYEMATWLSWDTLSHLTHSTKAESYWCFLTKKKKKKNDGPSVALNFLGVQAWLRQTSHKKNPSSPWRCIINKPLDERHFQCYWHCCFGRDRNHNISSARHFRMGDLTQAETEQEGQKDSACTCVHLRARTRAHTHTLTQTFNLQIFYQLFCSTKGRYTCAYVVSSLPFQQRPVKPCITHTSSNKPRALLLRIRGTEVQVSGFSRQQQLIN